MAEKTDPFLERLQRAAKIRQRIDKLLAVAEKHPETPEGQSARRMAEELAAKHGIPLSGGVGPQTLKPRINAGAFAAFGAAIKKQFPGQIDESDLKKPNYRVVDKDEDSSTEDLDRDPDDYY